MSINPNNINVSLNKGNTTPMLELWHCADASCGEYRTETICQVPLSHLMRKDVLAAISAYADIYYNKKT